MTLQYYMPLNQVQGHGDLSHRITITMCDLFTHTGKIVGLPVTAKTTVAIAGYGPGRTHTVVRDGADGYLLCHETASAGHYETVLPFAGQIHTQF